MTPLVYATGRARKQAETLLPRGQVLETAVSYNHASGQLELVGETGEGDGS